MGNYILQEMHLILYFFFRSQIDNDRINSYVEVLQRCANENPQLICCVLGKKAPDR